MSGAHEAIKRFGVKQADYLSMAPAVALPTLGAFLGRAIAGPRAANVGGLVGGLVGGVGGLAAREAMRPDMVENYNQPMQVPSYTIDPSTEDIPEWALEGARILKQAGITQYIFEKRAEGIRDFVVEPIPGFIPVEQAVKGIRERGWLHGLGRGAKTFAGVGLGGILGTAVGGGLGKGIAALTGRDPNIPLVNLPLSEILAGLGGSIGAVKGLRHVTKPQGMIPAFR